METTHYEKLSYPENKPEKNGHYDTNKGKLYYGVCIYLTAAQKGHNDAVEGWMRNVGDNLTLKGVEHFYKPLPSVREKDVEKEFIETIAESLKRSIHKQLCEEASAEIIYTAISPLLSIRGEDGWVSVKDRLPEKGERVLCDTIYGIQTGWLCNDNTWAFNNGGTQKKITHWQPLPAPPKQI